MTRRCLFDRSILISILVDLLHEFAYIRIGIHKVDIIGSQKCLNVSFRVLRSLDDIIPDLPFILVQIEVAFDDFVANLL